MTWTVYAVFSDARVENAVEGQHTYEHTCLSIQAGQNHLASPAGRSVGSIGGSRHIRWKALGHPSQYMSDPSELHDEQWSSLDYKGGEVVQRR